MKCFNFFIFLMLHLFSINAQSVPDRINYQLAVRDQSGKVVSDRLCSFQIFILTNPNSSTYIFGETHKDIQIKSGVGSLLIGSGTEKSNSTKISQIPFLNGNYYIKVEIDTNNGSNYKPISTTQLVSVPYAIVANESRVTKGIDPNIKISLSQLSTSGATADDVIKLKNNVWTIGKDAGGVSYTPGKGINISGSNEITNIGDGDSSSTNELQTLAINGNQLTISRTGSTVTLPSNGGFTHYVGEIYGGGIVFYVYKDKSNQEHGLIASLNNSSPYKWGNTNTQVLNAKSSWDGFNNTNEIISQFPNQNYAANEARKYRGGGFTDWYLPSIDELLTLSKERFLINKALDIKNNTSRDELTLNKYWSSNDYGAINALLFDFGENAIKNTNKSTDYNCRFIRAF